MPIIVILLTEKYCVSNDVIFGQGWSLKAICGRFAHNQGPRVKKFNLYFIPCRRQLPGRFWHTHEMILLILNCFVAFSLTQNTNSICFGQDIFIMHTQVIKSAYGHWRKQCKVRNIWCIRKNSVAQVHAAIYLHCM